MSKVVKPKLVSKPIEKLVSKPTRKSLTESMSKGTERTASELLDELEHLTAELAAAREELNEYEHMTDRMDISYCTKCGSKHYGKFRFCKDCYVKMKEDNIKKYGDKPGGNYSPDYNMRGGMHNRGVRGGFRGGRGRGGNIPAPYNKKTQPMGGGGNVPNYDQFERDEKVWDYDPADSE